MQLICLYNSRARNTRRVIQVTTAAVVRQSNGNWHTQISTCTAEDPPACHGVDDIEYIILWCRLGRGPRQTWASPHSCAFTRFLSLFCHRYDGSLRHSPLRTKCATSGVLACVQVRPRVCRNNNTVLWPIACVSTHLTRRAYVNGRNAAQTGFYHTTEIP